MVDAVLAAVARRVPLHVSRDDLASAGKLALVEALLRYEGPPEQVRGYCYVRVRGAVLDVFTAEPLATVEVPNHPQNPDMGNREIPISNEVWIEREDFMEVPEKKFFRLGPDRYVRLKGGHIIRCTGFEKDADGAITLIRAEILPGSVGADSPEGVVCKAAIHWVDVATGTDAEKALASIKVEVELGFDEATAWRAAPCRSGTSTIRPIPNPKRSRSSLSRLFWSGRSSDSCQNCSPKW